MFTGLIEEVGRVSSLETSGANARIYIAARKVVENSAEGDSIAVNGVCLTAVNITAQGFTADVSSETLNRSTLGSLRSGSAVNLERAVTPSTRLGGHIVQGHVDARGTFREARQTGDFRTVRIGFSDNIAPYLVEKGSVSVEGISLTIAALGEDWFEIAVIPQTWTATNLSALKSGDAVNLEADIIAKYVERILTVGEKKKTGLTLEKLASLGYTT